MLKCFIIIIIIEQETARQILRKAPGVVIIDDRELNDFPTPLGVLALSLSLSLLVYQKWTFDFKLDSRMLSIQVSNKDDVAVGRIRQDISQDDNRG